MGRPSEDEVARVREAWGTQAWDRVVPVLRLWALQAIPYGFGIDPDTCEDIAAEVVIRAWQSEMVPDNPAAWTVRVTRNLCLDWQKATMRRKTLSDGEDPDLCESAGPAPDAFIDREFRSWLAVRAAEHLAHFPELARQQFSLVAWHRYPSHTIAPRLRMQPAALRMAVTRVRRQLQQQLRRHLF